jgi:hypothetical protein
VIKATVFFRGMIMTVSPAFSAGRAAVGCRHRAMPGAAWSGGRHQLALEPQNPGHEGRRIPGHETFPVAGRAHCMIAGSFGRI